MSGHRPRALGTTAQSIKRETVRRVCAMKVHPRESFDEAVNRLLVDRAVLLAIERNYPKLVADARQGVAAA